MQQPGQTSQVCLPLSGSRLPQASRRGAFVLNLVSSGTPVALSEPQQAELRKFTFFVSRRRETGRERFRLHMGYFDSQNDAEQLLPLVREIYPGAWAGVAPGQRAPAEVPAPAPAPAAPVMTESIAAASAPGGELQLEIEPAPPPAGDEHFAATQSLSSVRAAIASLDDSTPLSAPQALQMLEAPPAPASARVTGAPPVLASAAVTAYAVQLRWSPQPLGLSELPPLAIFDAYTLYRAKGRQDGRHWHAVRLGFFQDRVAANQVLGYIRSEFPEADIVGVGAAERDSALGAAAGRQARKAASAPQPPVTPPAAAGDAFRLIEDHVPAQAASGKLAMMLTDDIAMPKPSPAAPATSARRAASAKKAERRPPANLEETLDILGAGNLKLDAANGEMLDASGVRRLRHAAERKVPARSPLSRLFGRLAEALGGGR